MQRRRGVDLLFVLTTFSYSNSVDFLRFIFKEALGLAKRGLGVVIVSSKRSVATNHIDGLTIETWDDKGARVLKLIPYFAAIVLLNVPIIPVLVCALGVRGTAGMMRRAASLLYTMFKFKVSLVHANFAYPEGLATFMATRIFKRPYTTYLRGRDIVINRRANYGLRLNRFINELILRVLRNSDSIVVLNRNFIDILQELKIQGGNVFYVPHGIDLNTFNPRVDGRLVRGQYGIGPNDFLVVSMSHLRKVKGIDFLIKAIKVCRDLRPELSIKALICGRDLGARRFLEGMIEELGLQNYVLLVGEVPRSKVPLYLAASDVVVSLVFVGGFSVDVIEALACGRPVIAAKVKGVDVLVKDGYNGFLVNPFDCQEIAERILNLAENSQLAKTLGANGRKTVEGKFSLDAQVDGLLKAFRCAFRRWIK